MAGLTNHETRLAIEVVAAFEDAIVSLSLNMQPGSPERAVVPEYLLALAPQIEMIAHAIENQPGKE